MDEKLKKLSAKKRQLDKLRPLPPEQVKNIQEWLDVEYTYTSNAIEGSTLNRSETALVIEKGITVRGKTLREHLEATNHAKAIEFVRSMVEKGHQFITEDDIKNIHKIVLAGNSVGNDRRFIDRYLPKVAAHLHYRLVDVSSFKEIFREKYNLEFSKSDKHRAVDDIYESISELGFYLSHVRVPTPTGSVKGVQQ